jgi:hypothetical protein
MLDGYLPMIYARPRLERERPMTRIRAISLQHYKVHTVRIKTSISHRSITGGKSSYLKEIVRIRLKVSQLVSAKPARNQLRGHVTRSE